MKRFGLLWAVLLGMMGSVWAQTNIRIHGTTVNGEGRTIELYKYSDALSHQEVLIDEAVIGENKAFELKGYANYPMRVFVQIENYSQSFYVEPGKDYEIYIPRFDWNIDERKNVYLSPEALTVEFVGLKGNDLNFLIDRFDRVVDSFITANRAAFDVKYHPQKRYFDTLDSMVNKMLPDGENEFFDRYKLYQLAQLKYNLHFETRRNLVYKYIKGNPILYYDENYMQFVTTLFANSVSKGNKYVTAHQLQRWVGHNNLEMMIDSMGTDPLLRNEQLRELVALQALKEAFNNGRMYDRDEVRAMIEKLARKTKFGDHRVLAQNMLKQCSRMERGSEVPRFSLPDVDKNMVGLDEFKGKWVYLSFVRVGDPNSIGEIETLAHFKDSVYAASKNVAFVTIVCDREFQKMYHFLKNTRKGEKYNWTWLHFNNNFKLLEHYKVVSYPTFLLINPEGKLQYNVTPAPASGFLLSPPWIDKKQDQEKKFFLGQ